MASLYNINSEMQYLLESINQYAEENGGEITDEMSEAYDKISIDRDKKIEDTVLFIKSLTAESKMIKNEEKALADRRKAVDKKTANITNWLMGNLSGAKFKSGKCAVSYRNSTAVEILNSESISDEYLNIKEIVTKTPDKASIKEALLKGVEVKGAELVKRTKLVVK